MIVTESPSDRSKIHIPEQPETASPFRRRILCADDNAQVGEILVRLFSQEGHAVDHVPDGVEAWDRISQDLGRFDVLVTDHGMPGLNGLELVELLRQANFPGRIVVHTSGVTPEEAERYRRFGVDAIVMKPATLSELVRVVLGGTARRSLG